MYSLERGRWGTGRHRSQGAGVQRWALFLRTWKEAYVLRCLVEAYFLFHRWPSFHEFSFGRKGEGALWGLFHKSTKPFTGFLWLNYPLKSFLPNTVMLGFRFQHMKFGRTQNSTYNKSCYLFLSIYLSHFTLHLIVRWASPVAQW